MKLIVKNGKLSARINGDVKIIGDVKEKEGNFNFLKDQGFEICSGHVSGILKLDIGTSVSISDKKNKEYICEEDEYGQKYIVIKDTTGKYKDVSSYCGWEIYSDNISYIGISVLFYNINYDYKTEDNSPSYYIKLI